MAAATTTWSKPPVRRRWWIAVLGALFMFGAVYQGHRMLVERCKGELHLFASCNGCWTLTDQRMRFEKEGSNMVGNYLYRYYCEECKAKVPAVIRANTADLDWTVAMKFPFHVFGMAALGLVLGVACLRTPGPVSLGLDLTALLPGPLYVGATWLWPGGWFPLVVAGIACLLATVGVRVYLGLGDRTG